VYAQSSEQPRGPGLPPRQEAAARITTTDLSGATLFQGAGCNVIALPGPDGALMIDGGRAANADALLTAVKTATRTSRIHTLINTHWHPDQTGVNEAVGRDRHHVARERGERLVGEGVLAPREEGERLGAARQQEVEEPVERRAVVEQADDPGRRHSQPALMSPLLMPARASNLATPSSRSFMKAASGPGWCSSGVPAIGTKGTTNG
jgi:hypothetical protein